MKAIIAVVAAVALAGCQTTAQPPIMLAAPVVAEKPLAERIPSSVLTCRPEPSGAAVATNTQAARYIVALRAAGADCRRNLGTVSKIIDAR